MSDRLAESHRYCRQLTRRKAANFGYAFWALPKDERQAMNVLYAFMRLTDDIGDDPQLDQNIRAENLAHWRGDLEAAVNKKFGSHPVWPAVAEIIERYDIPVRHLQAVIDGVAMDLTPRECETFSDLENYCYHVAGAVGLCCIRIWGCRDERAEQPAIDCGVAFQLTNILRDLNEDAAQNRVYLPREDFERFGYAVADLRQKKITREFLNLMAFETERAWSYYRRAERLAAYLPPPGKRVLRIMSDIYGGLLRAIERRGFDVFSRRVRLPAWRKLWIAGKALCGPDEPGVIDAGL